MMKGLGSNILLQPKFQTTASFTESQLLLLEKYQSFYIFLINIFQELQEKGARNGPKK